jgi:hypothetical protein
MMLGRKRLNRTRKQRLRGKGSRPDANMTGGADPELAGFFFEGAHAVDDVAGALNQPFRRVRWLDGVAGSVKELLPELIFEPLKASAERRLCDVMGLSRLHEAPKPIKRLKMLKLLQLHANDSLFQSSQHD